MANVGEARRISQASCRTRPYILGPAFPEEREEIVLNGWRSFISTMEEAAHYNSLARLYGKTLPIHLSVDTGMGRGGFLPDQLEELLSRLGELDSLHLEGLGAHLPARTRTGRLRSGKSPALNRWPPASGKTAFEVLPPGQQRRLPGL